MDQFDFSEDEIREQLELLGYRDIPPERLKEFKKDLEQLVQHEQSQSSSMSSDSPPYHKGDGEHIHHSKPPLHKQQVPPPIQFSRAPVQIPTEGRLQRAMSDTTLDTSAASSDTRRIIKRKVLRKVGGQSQIFDESSVTESETGDDVDHLEHQIRNMQMRGHHYTTRPSTAPEHRAKWHARPTSAEPVYRLSEDYEGPKALIRPMSKEPHKQNLHKSDPVARHQKYRTSWKSQKAPGERAHNNLRWNVREHMLYHDQVVSKKQRPVTAPNDYKVPTDKKRKALRWQVRHDLAQGLLPPSILD